MNELDYSKFNWTVPSAKERREGTIKEPVGIGAKPADEQEPMDKGFYESMYDAIMSYFDNAEEADRVLTAKEIDKDRVKGEVLREFDALDSLLSEDTETPSLNYFDEIDVDTREEMTDAQAKNLREVAKTEFGQPLEGQLKDVTDTEEGKLTNEEPLYELGKQIREETIKTEGLMSKPSDDSADGVQPTDGKVWLSSQLDTILETEGGFQNDKEDDGNYVDGKLIGTNKGITPAALAEYRGVDPSTITVEDIKGITDKEAREIYEQNYYYKTKINELPENIQASVFDMNINAGPNAIKILQRLAGVKDDGIIGPQTIKEVQEANITLDQYADARIEYYKQVVKNDPDKKKYLKGWINRANKYREA